MPSGNGKETTKEPSFEMLGSGMKASKGKGDKSSNRKQKRGYYDDSLGQGKATTTPATGSAAKLTSPLGDADFNFHEGESETESGSGSEGSSGNGVGNGEIKGSRSIARAKRGHHKSRNLDESSGLLGVTKERAEELYGYLAGPMASPSGIEHVMHFEHKRRITSRDLLVLLFFTVSGGPVGSEDAISSAGPMWGILLCLIFPVVFSVPMALMSAELASAFPDDGGYTLWVQGAYGPFLAFQEGYWSWISGVLDNALYPVLVVDTTHQMMMSTLSADPVAASSYRWIATTVVSIAIATLNYAGIRFVGRSLVILGAVVILPYFIFVLICLPYIQPELWLQGPQWSALTSPSDTGAIINVRGKLFTLLGSVFWNFSGWDGISTFAGEVENPTKTYPRALFGGVLLVTALVVFPLLAGVGVGKAFDVPPWQSWTDGSFVEILGSVGGTPLRFLAIVGSIASAIAMFTTEMFVDSYLLVGMAEQGLAPDFFRKRLNGSTGPPHIAITFSLIIIVIVAGFMDFQELLQVNNCISSLALILEVFAAIHLRLYQRDMPRPFKVPVNRAGYLAMLTPGLLILAVIVIGSFLEGGVQASQLSAGIIVFGAILYLFQRNTFKKRLAEL